MKVGSRVQCLVAELDFEAEVSTTESVHQVEIEQIGFTDLVVVDPDSSELCVCGYCNFVEMEILAEEVMRRKICSRCS
ncbi:hypothetical protein F0562_012367 [Nyssa sinensis]|uniref:Uncharacterized protein n=1 Tax=Nyssa sinensis TaxID=561372 RepID=A0A5J4ZS24_9ASTE|nr:hypothetical protein F0562_012367 [Nyssa sinensis]